MNRPGSIAANSEPPVSPAILLIQSDGGGKNGTGSGMLDGAIAAPRSTPMDARASGSIRDGNGGALVALVVATWLTPGSIGWAVERMRWAVAFVAGDADAAFPCL